MILVSLNRVSVIRWYTPSGLGRAWSRFDAFVQPGQEQLVSNRQNDGADEEANNTHCDEPSHRPQENYEDGDREAPSEQQRLQDVVHEGNEDAPNQEGHCLSRARSG